MKDELDEQIAAGMRELARRGVKSLRLPPPGNEEMFRRDQVQEIRPLTKDPEHDR